MLTTVAHGQASGPHTGEGLKRIGAAGARKSDAISRKGIREGIGRIVKLLGCGLGFQGVGDAPVGGGLSLGPVV